MKERKATRHVAQVRSLLRKSVDHPRRTSRRCTTPRPWNACLGPSAPFHGRAPPAPCATKPVSVRTGNARKPLAPWRGASPRACTSHECVWRAALRCAASIPVGHKLGPEVRVLLCDRRLSPPLSRRAVDRLGVLPHLGDVERGEELVVLGPTLLLVVGWRLTRPDARGGSVSRVTQQTAASATGQDGNLAQHARQAGDTHTTPVKHTCQAHTCQAARRSSRPRGGALSPGSC